MGTSQWTADVVGTIERACELGAWSEMADKVNALAERLPARLELLARSVIDLLDEEEFDLAVGVWGHLHDAAITHADRGGLGTGFSPSR